MGDPIRGYLQLRRNGLSKGDYLNYQSNYIGEKISYEANFNSTWKSRMDYGN